MNELVIFDLDGVIINGQGQLFFLNYLFRKKIIGRFFYLKIFVWFVFYKLGWVKNPEKVMNYAFSFLKNREEKETKEIVSRFFEEDLKKFIFPEIIDIINEHKAKNRELLIISNSADIITEKIAQFLGIKNYIATRLEIVGGKFTGKIWGNIVYGKNKAEFAREFALKNDLSFRDSYSYADHISDLDLMLLASNPFAVNPDKLLFQEAKNRNWPILIFKK